MSGRDNLTRWNRAGLHRFDYIDGTGPLFLEQLKQDLRARFEDRWSSLPPAVGLSDETGLSVEEAQFQKNNLLVQQYYGERGDIGWEMVRAFSQACHVLTGHLNAHANEAYLRTATQWDNVRRLVGLIDYHPAAATSASTQLVLVAKKDRKGVVSKGFQVKHLPATGGDKVVFETLEDLYVDDALNELRPTGWNQSNDSPVEGGPAPEPAEPEYSEIANRPVYQMQDIGEGRADILNTLTDPEEFRIRDFLGLDPDNPGFPGAEKIPATWLREFKAKARVICDFETDAVWADIADWKLARIVAERDELLVEITGKNPDKVRALKLRTELIGVYLDHRVYKKAKLKDLLAPANGAGAQAPGVKTAWRAKRKPRVEPGQVAMVLHEHDDLAEAVTIEAVEEENGSISLLPSPLQYTWSDWPKSAASLYVSPRWKRACWLNGTSVVRTEKPHGLTAGAFISWKKNHRWRFAEVVEADENNLRLGLTGNLPDQGTPIYEGRPLKANVMATDLEAIGLANGDHPNVEEVTFGEGPEPIFTMKDPSSINPSPPGFTFPPGGLDFGSFLFPTPMLPMDLVKAAVELMLNLGIMVIPSTGEAVFKSLLDPQDIPTVDDLFNILKDKVSWRSDLTTEALQKAALAEMLKTPQGDPIVMFKEILDNLEKKGPLIAVKKDSPVKAIVASSSPRYVVNGGPGKMENGGWVVGEFKDGLRALKVRTINEFTTSDEKETFSITFEDFSDIENELIKLHADFRRELVADGAAVNSDPVNTDEIELEDVPESLKIGRKVLLTADDKMPVAAKIESVDGNTVKISPPAPGFSKGELVIRGNVVDASHGSAKPIKRLSTGITGQKTFSLLFDVKNVSSISDPTFPRGVRADVELVIDGLTWQQVPRLDASKPTDSHYAARATEDGYLRFEFGGRRPPSGTNNVSVKYRVGAGRSGNLPAGSLIKAVHPHPLIASVEQPVDSVGGEEIESVEFMRENAPATLLALERSVSLADFENLAMSRNDVWQAKAFYHPAAGTYLDRVRLVIVPAGGGATSASFKKDLEEFLAHHALPTVSVRIRDYSPKEIKLKVDIRADLSKYDPIVVMTDVRTRLLESFALERRQISQAFYLSEVYHVVEGTRGVSDSSCVFQGDPAHRLSTESEDQVIYLGTDPDDLLIDYHGYTP